MNEEFEKLSHKPYGPPTPENIAKATFEDGSIEKFEKWARDMGYPFLHILNVYQALSSLPLTCCQKYKHDFMRLPGRFYLQVRQP